MAQMIVAEFVDGGPLDGAVLELETAVREYRNQNAVYERAERAEGKDTSGRKIWRYALHEEAVDVGMRAVG